MGNVFEVLLTTIKSMFTSFVTKFKQWTNWSFIRTNIINKVRGFLVKILDVRPRHKKDYYEIFGWLVSRRLVTAAVVVLGVVSLYYLSYTQQNLIASRVGGIPTYKYNSIMLRFAEERVRIKAKAGYVAYEGDVAKGVVTGSGTLYNKDGIVVYQGQFENNEYNGNGNQFYDDGTRRYIGGFQSNLYEGTGKLYRANASLEYSGEFSQGMKEGEGILYDNSGTMIYTGAFSKDEIVYGNLVGKPVSEIASVYRGKRLLYEGDGNFAAVLEDISVIYSASGDEGALQDEMIVDTVYIMKDTFPVGQKKCSTIPELRKYFGEADYEGNSSVNIPEALAINWMVDKGILHTNAVSMELTSEYSDYQIVEGLDEEYTIYLYSFHNGGLIYTFACENKDGAFMFYWVEKGEGEEAQ